jgi:hypothetical protein
MDRQLEPGATTLITEASVDSVASSIPGKRTLVGADLSHAVFDGRSRSAPMISPDHETTGENGSHAKRPHVAAGEASPALSIDRLFGRPPHAAPAPRVADRGHSPLNAVLKVVAYDEHGTVIRSWGAKAHWVGPLPQHFHGDHGGGRWRWDKPASAQTVRVDTRADGSGGMSVETWAGKLHATRLEIFAEPIGAVTERAEARPSDSHDPHAPGHGEDAGDAGDGPSKKVRPTGDHPAGVPPSLEAGAKPADPLADAIAFEHELGIYLIQDENDGDGPAKPRGKDGDGGAGYEAGDPAGRTGKDASTTGQGPGGDAAKEDGDDEGSRSTRDNQGTKTGDQNGEHHGSANGRYGGEGREGDDGVRGAGAIFGGVVAVPAAIKGAVELALLAEAGDITGAGADLFKAGVGKAMSVAVARRLVAREARIVAERETRAVVKKLAGQNAFAALSQGEREQVQRIVYWEKQREFFRGDLQAARAEQRAMRQALKKAKPAEQAALEARRTAAATGEEIAKAEPVAGQLPRNHAYAGREYPRSQLPPQYREKGLRFKETGYPDFEPYAKMLPNGEKKVRIAYTGARRTDDAAALKAAKLEEVPRGYTWHHDEQTSE